MTRRTGSTGFFFVTEADRRRRMGDAPRCPPGFVWNRPQQACVVVRGTRMYGMAGAALSGACPNETAKVIGAGLGGAMTGALLGVSPFSLVGAAVTIPGALLGASVASALAGAARGRWPQAFEGPRGLRGVGGTVREHLSTFRSYLNHAELLSSQGDARGASYHFARASAERAWIGDQDLTPTDQTRFARARMRWREAEGRGRPLRGDLMRCVQYARTPRGTVRCVTMSPGPGAPDDDAREDAGIVGRYRYRTDKSPTRGEKQKKKRGIDVYPRVHRSDDERRLRTGRNVPVPGARSAQGRAQRRAA